MKLFVAFLLAGSISVAWAMPAHDQDTARQPDPPSIEQLIQEKQRAYRLAVRTHDTAQARALARQLSEHLSAWGNTHYRAGRYGQSASAGRAGLYWLDRAGTDVDTLHFQLLSLTGASYGRVPLADSATAWYARTSAYLIGHSQLRQTAPDDVCGYYMGHAYFLSRVGDSRQAFDYLQVAAELARKTGNRRLLAIIHNYTGNYFFQSRQFDRADLYYRKALHGYEAGTVDQCWGYVILGNNDRVAQRPTDGLANLLRGRHLYRKRIARHPQDRDVDLEIQTSYYTAECLRALGRTDAATDAYRISLTLHRQQHGNRGEFIAYSWLGLAHIARQRTDRRLARALAQRAARASSYRLDAQDSPTDYVGTVVNEKTLYESLRLEADLWLDDWQAHHDRSALNRAVQRYDLALTVAARLRRNLMPAESKFFLSNNVAPSVGRAVAGCFTLLRQTAKEADKNRLFALIERHRAMVTSDVLHERYRMASTLPPRLVRREQNLRQQKLDLEKGLAEAPANARRDSLRRQLNAVRVTSYQFLDSLERAYPRYYALKYAMHTLSVADVQQRLPDQAGYLTYFVSEQDAIGFLITQTGSHAFRVALPRQFAGTVNQLWESIRHDPGMFRYTGRQPAAALYAWLIRPVETQLRSVQRLIVARDGLLHYVPFDLLAPATSPAAYLGERVAISYGYSAELTFTQPETSPTGPPHPVGYAPFDADDSTPLPDSLSPLPQSLAEVRAWGGRLFAGRAATRQSFLRMTPQSNVIILATHALADEQHPERSYVAFHPDRTDSRLRIADIVNLSLDHLKLVILSACRGNMGVLQRGEGLLSLARAFRLAGCRTVLTTSWSASDESTAALNTLFQQYVARGLPTDRALQYARADFRTDKRFRRWNHPYHWANFTLIGSPVTLYPEPVVPGRVIGLGVVCVLGLALGGWVVWRRLAGQAGPRKAGPRKAGPRQAL